MAPKVLDYYAEAGLSAVFYDRIAACDSSVSADVDFYTARIAKAGPRVLELGCGTGRVALALAARGLQVTGVDNAPAMLSRAESKREKQPEDIRQRLRFRLGDMTRLRLDERFDAVLIPYYGLNHLPTASQRGAALAVLARHLRAGGVGVAHVMAPGMLQTPLAEDDASRNGILFRFDATERRLRLRALERSIDPRRQSSAQLVEYAVVDPDGSIIRRSVERLAYAWFDDAEVESLAASAGLKVGSVETSFTAEQAGNERIYLFEPA